MKPWDIYAWEFPGIGAHPAVIISHQDRVSLKPQVCVLLCSSQRANRPPKPHEVLLNSADGLDWETLVKCDMIYAAQKDRLKDKRGVVSPARRRQIAERVVRCLAFAGL